MESGIAKKEVPNYKEALDEIIKHLRNRQKLLWRRTLYIVGPFLSAIILIYILYRFAEKNILNIGSTTELILILIASLWLIYSFFHLIATKLIFSLEKYIWIDSYYDNKKLSQKQSWRIAKKLLWSALSLKIYIFFKYHFWFFLIFFSSLFLSFYFPIALKIKYNPWIWVATFIIFLPIVMYMAFYYLKIKLRYIWFVFLDFYGQPEFSYKNLFQEMKQLNDINKGETFKKSLMTNLGADLSYQGVTTVVGSTVSWLTKDLGKDFKFAGGILTAGANEIANYNRLLGINR